MASKTQKVITPENLGQGIAYNPQTKKWEVPFVSEAEIEQVPNYQPPVADDDHYVDIERITLRDRTSGYVWEAVRHILKPKAPKVKEVVNETYTLQDINSHYSGNVGRSDSAVYKAIQGGQITITGTMTYTEGEKRGQVVAFTAPADILSENFSILIYEGRVAGLDQNSDPSFTNHYTLTVSPKTITLQDSDHTYNVTFEDFDDGKIVEVTPTPQPAPAGGTANINWKDVNDREATLDKNSIVVNGIDNPDHYKDSIFTEVRGLQTNATLTVSDIDGSNVESTTSELALGGPDFAYIPIYSNRVNTGSPVKLKVEFKPVVVNAKGVKFTVNIQPIEHIANT